MFSKNVFVTILPFSLLFQVRVLDEASNLHSQIITNATTTSIVLTNLTDGLVYNIKAAALTAPGIGPFSPSIHPKIGINEKYFK